MDGVGEATAKALSPAVLIQRQIPCLADTAPAADTARVLLCALPAERELPTASPVQHSTTCTAVFSPGNMFKLYEIMWHKILVADNIMKYFYNIIIFIDVQLIIRYLPRPSIIIIAAFSIWYWIHT
jgi:hypothetical protein